VGDVNVGTYTYSDSENGPQHDAHRL
jgi:hypothetical protein